MRTYSLTVPLPERTFTVLGYMRTIVTTCHRKLKVKNRTEDEYLASDCHYIFRASEGCLRSQDLENKGVSRAWAAGPGGFTPNMGYANGELRKDQQNDEVLRFID